MIAALAFACLGGIYFGLFSCGGYVWHRPLYFGLLAAITLVALVVPSRRTRPILERIGVVAGISVAFFFTEALAAPFYPATPESWSEFMRSLPVHVRTWPMLIVRSNKRLQAMRSKPRAPETWRLAVKKHGSDIQL
jgi:hypothetical protein